MNTQKSVFKKIAKINEPKVELSEVQKVELARKPQSILGDVSKLDNKIRSEESKLDKIYLNYKEAQKAWVSLMNDINSQLDRLEDDLIDISNAAKEIGADPKTIDGYQQALDEIIRVGKIANQGRTLYPSV